MFDRAKQQALREQARITAERAKAQNREREAQQNREMFTAFAKYWTPSQGHERGAHPPGHSEHVGWSYPRVRVYDNEPWHWPPKTKEESMALTQEQYNQVMAVHEHVTAILRDRIYGREEPFSLSIEEAQEVAEDLANDLFDRGFVNLEAVEGDL